MNIQITVSVVKELIQEQFPEWANLPIMQIEPGGIDNQTFRLGQNMLVRLPSAKKYALQVQKEQKWLPKLAAHISCKIPKPLALGKPSKNYPRHWSIYEWIEGESANNISLSSTSLQQIASDLSLFLNDLHKINISDGPIPGQHNFFRGDHLSVYDNETRSMITRLQDIIDVDTVTSVWEKAVNSKWNKNPVWIHGDLSSGNILIKDNQLAAVIDFGCMAIGDPACDLTIAWTLLKNESRKIFKTHTHLDTDTWARARGWALWKALITIVSLENKKSAEAVKQQEIINEILNEYKKIN